MLVFIFIVGVITNEQTERVIVPENNVIKHVEALREKPNESKKKGIKGVLR